MPSSVQSAHRRSYRSLKNFFRIGVNERVKVKAENISGEVETDL